MHIKHGGVPPLRSVVPLGYRVERLYLNRYNFGCSDSLFDSRGRFSGSSYPTKTFSRSRSKGRVHGNHFLVSIGI